jgi:HK97 family phage major capsid protein
LVAGQPATLLGFLVVECEDMSDVSASGLAIAFGDFEKGYLIVDRADVRVLRDPYTAKPFVMFYFTKRLGGGIQNFDAIKLLRFTVS